MRSMLLKWVTGLVTLFFLSVAFADSHVSPHAKSFIFPGSNHVLKNGDIILSNSYGLYSALNSHYGSPQGRYSHALVYMEDSQSGGVLLDFSGHGLQELSPDLSIVPTNEMALVRPRTAPAPGALSSALKQLKSRQLQFDYEMRWPALESSSTYCAGFVSQLFRLAALPDPFPPNEKGEAPDRFITQWARENLGLDLEQVVSPNKVLFLDSYELISEYKPRDLNASLPRIISRAAVRKVQDYLEQDGLMLLPPRAGSSFVIGLTNAGSFDGVTIAQLPEHRRASFLSLQEFTQKVIYRVTRHVRLHDETDWTEQDVEEVSRAVADQYRDSFFTKRNPG